MNTTHEEAEIVNPETLEMRRAIRDPNQAHSICKRLLTDNEDRNGKAAAIERKYNDEPPYSAAKLRASGQKWRHNRSTGFLSTMVKRMAPSYLQTVDSARYLTSSSLNPLVTDGDRLSEAFQTGITKCIRQWQGWQDFKEPTVIENLLHGYASISWNDRFDWKPILIRQDDALYPDGVGMDASKIPLWVWRRRYQIHELADKLSDSEASAAVGWNIDNLVTAINNAQPDNRFESTTGDERRLEDLVRESSLGRTYSEGVKVIKTYHLFVQEPTGKISHYMLEEKSGHLLYKHLDEYASMNECLALLTIESGNGKLHGSKGAGRILYNTHVAIDQARNLICDQLYLSGCVFLKATQRGMTNAAITVSHPFVILGEGFEVLDVKINVNSEAFFALDRHLVSLAEQQIGAFMPSQLTSETGQKRTASEVNYVASVEQQIKEGLLARFWGQWLTLVFEIQKRICSVENIEAALKIYRLETSGLARMSAKLIDFAKRIGRAVTGDRAFVQEADANQDAIDVIVEMFREGLSAEQVFELANTPPNLTSSDFSKDSLAIDAVVAKYINDPEIQKNELKRLDIAAKLGNELANKLVISAEDNTVVAEAARMQLLELGGLLLGEEVPVSPRDNDVIHMSVIVQKLSQLLPTIKPGAVTPQTMKIAGTVLAHFDTHLQGATAKGDKSAQIEQFAEFSKSTHDLIDQASQTMAAMEPSVPPGAVPMDSALNDAAGVVPGPESVPGEPPMGAPIPAIPVIPAESNLPLSRGPRNLTPKVTP